MWPESGKRSRDQHQGKKQLKGKKADFRQPLRREEIGQNSFLKTQRSVQRNLTQTGGKKDAGEKEKSECTPGDRARHHKIYLNFGNRSEMT